MTQTIHIVEFYHVCGKRRASRSRWRARTRRGVRAHIQRHLVLALTARLSHLINWRPLHFLKCFTFLWFVSCRQAGRRGAGKDSIRPTALPGYYTLHVCQLRGREVVQGLDVSRCAYPVSADKGLPVCVRSHPHTRIQTSSSCQNTSYRPAES